MDCRGGKCGDDVTFEGNMGATNCRIKNIIEEL
jgi:hypothetical protein